MGKIIDLTEQRFGRLIAKEPTKRRGRNRSIVWRCLCDCGNEVYVSSNNLRTGHTESCGCLMLDMKTGHGMSKTREHNSWYSMIQRCYNPNHPRYKDYGGRGIKVCERWRNSFEAFYEDMGSRLEGKTLDRWPDNDGNYELFNCKWSTSLEQRENRRPTSCGSSIQRWFFAFNLNMGLWYEDDNRNGFAREHGLSAKCISACLCGKQETHKGWTFDFLT